MSNLIYEREYAREILFAAMRGQAGGRAAGAGPGCADSEIAALIAQALEVGCARTKLVVELANLAASLAMPAPNTSVSRSREVPGENAPT